MGLLLLHCVYITPPNCPVFVFAGADGAALISDHPQLNSSQNQGTTLTHYAKVIALKIEEQAESLFEASPLTRVTRHRVSVALSSLGIYRFGIC